MSFPRYKRYKDSGVEWLGKVPEHWAVSRIKWIAEKIGSGKTPLGGSEVYASEGILFLRSQNVYDEGLRLDDAVYITHETDCEMENTRVNPGDILLNITGASIGRTTLVPTPFVPANVNQHVCIVRVSDIDKRPFVSLAMQADFVKSQISLAQTGAAREGLNFEQIGNLVFAMPPTIEESETIVAFLRREISQIDRLIEEQQRLIELLEEKHQAVISHAVTKGLYPDSPMKDSRADWIGQVPSHWVVERAGHLFTERDERSELGDEEMLTVSHLTGVTPRSEKTVNMFEAETTEGYKKVYPGDLVINTLWAWMGAMGVSSHLGIVSPAYHVYRPRLNMRSDYVNALVRVPSFAREASRWSKGVWSSRLRLYPQDMFQILFPVPPLEDQKKISERIREQEAKMAQLIEESERGIAILQERRGALISAAVTGKIDVRNYVTPPAAVAEEIYEPA
jgi:type I restriction enzyme S subunit